MTHRLYWVDLSRFDTKPNKSPWLEMARGLGRHGLQTCILTSYEHQPYENTHAKAIKVRSFRSSRRSGIFRAILLSKILFWSFRNITARDAVMLSPQALYLAPLLRLFCTRNLHLDFRTIPVEIHNWRDRLNRLVYWTLPIRLFGKQCRSFSFITNRLQTYVEREFKRTFSPSVVWQSGVNTSKFARSGLEPNNNEEFQFFYHGTITRNRGLVNVVRGIAQLRARRKIPATLRIVGAGNGVDEVLAEIGRNGLQDVVDYVGLVPYDLIPDEIAKADCCICPLPDMPEWNVSSPLKVFEYLAAGKPLIVTRIPAHEDVLGKHDFVVWAESADAAGMAGAMEAAYDQREKLIASSRDASSLAARCFDWSVQSGFLAEFLFRFQYEKTVT